MVDPLLAKSRSTPHVKMEITLTGHTKCVLWAVDALFGGKDAKKPLGASWLRFFGLAEDSFPRFRHHLRVAAAAHDWGKANDGFQNMVENTGEQVVRHEHLSGLLLAYLFDDSSTVA
jgi:CRISPR-associated endonuclease Cas3-HD